MYQQILHSIRVSPRLFAASPKVSYFVMSAPAPGPGSFRARLAHPVDELGEARAAVLDVFHGRERHFRDGDDLDRVEDQRVHAVEILDAPDVARAGRCDAAIAKAVRNDRDGPDR